MKIRYEILKVETTGENLCVVAQQSGQHGAAWRPLSNLTIRIPDSNRTRRTYHVGRIFEIAMTPK